VRANAKTDEPSFKTPESYSCDICGTVGTWDKTTWRWYPVAFRVWDRDDVVILCSETCEDRWFEGQALTRERTDDD